MDAKNYTKLFINKYQPSSLDDFSFNSEVVEILKTLILMNNLNILLVGNIIRNQKIVGLKKKIG